MPGRLVELAASVLRHGLLEYRNVLQAESLSQLLPSLLPCSTCHLHRTITDLPLESLKKQVCHYKPVRFSEDGLDNPNPKTLGTLHPEYCYISRLASQVLCLARLVTCHAIHPGCCTWVDQPSCSSLLNVYVILRSSLLDSFLSVLVLRIYWVCLREAFTLCDCTSLASLQILPSWTVECGLPLAVPP